MIRGIYLKEEVKEVYYTQIPENCSFILLVEDDGTMYTISKELNQNKEKYTLMHFNRGNNEYMLSTFSIGYKSIEEFIEKQFNKMKKTKIYSFIDIWDFLFNVHKVIDIDLYNRLKDKGLVKYNHY